MSQTPTSTQQLPDFAARRDDWIARVHALLNQIQGWAEAEHWETQRQNKIINEKLLGTYAIEELVVRSQGGHLIVNPVGLHIVGGDGRVDIEAMPTLSRVKLIGVGDGWQIWTDSNVPLRVPWDHSHFVQLAQDLLA